MLRLASRSTINHGIKMVTNRNAPKDADTPIWNYSLTHLGLLSLGWVDESVVVWKCANLDQDR